MKFLRTLTPFIVVFVLLVAAAPAHAAVLYDHSGVDGTMFTKPGGGFTIVSFVGAVSTTYATVLTQADAATSITGAAFVRVSADHQPYPLMVLTNPNGVAANCTSSATWTNVSGNIWQTTVSGCSGDFGGIEVFTNVAATTNFDGSATGGQTFDGSSNYLGAGLIAFQVCDSGGCTGGFTPPPSGDDCTNALAGTCIDSVMPPDDPSILDYASSSMALATSSAFAFGATGYIKSTDYVAGTYVENLYQPDDYDQVAAAICAVGGCRMQLKYPVSASGAYNFSTTTSITRIGNYTMTTDIKAPYSVNVFNFFSFNVPFAEKTLTSTTTNFQVSQPSSLDVVKAKLGPTYIAVGLSNHASSTVAQLPSGCAFTSITAIFDLTSPNNIFSCVVGFVATGLIPSDQQLVAIGANFQASIGVRPPFGYITRFSEIVSGNAIGTSTLPGLTISVPPILGLGTESATFPVWTNLMGSTSPFGMATSSVARGSKTFRQIVEPGWDIIVLTLLMFLIIWDALKIKH